MNLGDSRFKLQSSLEAFDGCTYTSLPGKHSAQIEVRFGVTRINSNGSSKVLYSFFKLAIRGEKQAKVVMAVGIVGADRENLAIVPRGVIIPSASGDVSRQIIMREA